MRRKVTFKGVTKYSPAKIYTLGLRLFSRISTLRIKHLDPTLNHVGFVHSTNTSEEFIYPLKELFTFKEAMNSQCKEKTSSEIVK